MYPSETEFVMPEGTEQNCETFFEEFFLPFLTGIEKDNETIIQDIKTYHEYEKREETPFYLLEMIKQILIDKNEKFEKYLIIATGKLDKLFESNSVNFFKLFNQNPDYKKALMSSILFLLPYSAEFFQKTGQITCFINLYSTFNLIIGINDSNEVKLINRYINVLFSDLDPHKAIIAMYFASIYKLDEENAEIFSIYITELLKKIPLSNFTDDIEFLTYYILFDGLNELLSKSLILGMIDIQIFVESVDQFFHNFCEKFEENENYEPNQSEIKIIRKISLYCSNFIWYYNNKSNYLYTENGGQIILICSYFAVLFYKNSYNIILSSKYALTKAIGTQLIWDVEFLINYNGENLILSNMEYFINLLFQLATFVTEDYEEIFESEENFFYDFYDIDFKKCDDYSNRQSLSLFILNSICESKKNGMILFNMIGMALGKLEQSQINEKHFFLVSVLNKVIENITIKDKETLSMLIELTIKYLNYGTEIIDNICDKGLFNELTNIIFIYTFYFLINSSFYLLKMNTELLGDDNSKVYESYNNELYRLMIIIQTLTNESAVKNNYCSTLFTFYCILMNNLIDEKKLTINDDSLNEFTTKNFESCFTNHGITLMYKSALVEKNNHLLLQAFFQYYEHCQTMISELIDLLKQRSGKDESEEEDFEVRSDRESDYILRFFSDNVFNMSTIIKIVSDFSIFDKETLQNFAVFLISKGSDKWPFVDECIHFMSAILIKTDNIKDWIGLYMSNVVKSSRIDNFYGEYIIPIINAVSYQPDQIDQPFFDYLVNLIKENMVNLTGDLYGEENRKYMATCDALMSFAFIIRLFEITILDEIKMSTQDVEFFIKFAIDIQPTEKDLEFSDDIVLEDQELGTNILKLASFLTISNPNFEDIFALFSKLLEEGQIVCNETRYIIIYLIDNVIKVEDMSQLKKLRELCLNNKIQYNANYREFYVTDIKYFVGDVIHPIYKIYPIEGFVVDDYQNFDFDEDSKDDENDENENDN